MKTRLLSALLILTAFAVTCAAVAFGSYFRAGLTVTVGRPSASMIKTTRDVENFVATENNRIRAEERAGNLEPIMPVDGNVWNRVSENLGLLFAKLEEIRNAFRDESERRTLLEAEQTAEAERIAEEKRLEEERLAELESQWAEEGLAFAGPETEYERENPADTNPEGQDLENTPPAAEKEYESYALFSSLAVHFIESQRHVIASIPEDDFFNLMETVNDVARLVLAQGIKELNDSIYMDVQVKINNRLLNREIAEIANIIVREYLTPNRFVDEEATHKQWEEEADKYERVSLLEGETIVNEGEIISDEAYAIMENLGMLNTGFRDKLIPMLGVFAFIAVIFLACALYLHFFRKPAGTRKKEILLLFTLYCLTLALVWIIGDFAVTSLLPLLIFPMLVSILIDMRTAIVLSFALTIICMFIVNGSMEYLLFYLIACLLICLFSKYTTERNKVFVVGILVTLIQFILSISISLIIEKNNALYIWRSILAEAGYASLNGMLTVIVCMGSLPFWETFFGVVTPIKLLDLTNPTNLLLRRLTIEAPGTYHHSLIVANLAETAAYDIGANPHTARVGGYYHDIGKLKYPQYFAENQAGENPHDFLDPYNSAQLLVSHVTYGLTLAAEYRLPQFIRDIIKEHHGTTLMQFFYCKAKNGGADGEVNEKDFRYPGVIPQTRESACVMLADTVEAAVRSMIPHVKSVDEVENQINILIRHKLNDSQLAESQLSIKDVDTIEKSFYRVLKGMYHERIKYPKLEEGKTVSLSSLSAYDEKEAEA